MGCLDVTRFYHGVPNRNNLLLRNLYSLEYDSHYIDEQFF